MDLDGRGARLIIVCGLPGAGKTTLAKELERDLRAVRFCPDEWMDRLGIDVWDEGRRAKIEGFQWELGRRLLELGQTIIVEWGTWGRSERDVLRTGAKAVGAAVELRYVCEPVEVLFERIERRGMEDPPIRMEQVRQWAEAFEEPTAEEMALYDGPEEAK